jgi:glycosyltransferase involved in cell wall biosynthesis
VVDVTIGLLVYNGAATIAAALDSLLAQTHRDFVIVISDNGSTDDTGAICERYARMDSRIRYERLAVTIPVIDNYRRLLEMAETPFFMWAAADDLWAPGFVAAHYLYLTEHEDYVLSQSRVLFWTNVIPSRMALGTYALRDSVQENTARFYRQPADNSRFYGLFRIGPLKASYPATTFYGFDWVVTGASLRFGRHHEERRILMVRDETPATHYEASVSRYVTTPLQRILPMLPLTEYVLKNRLAPLSLGLLGSLLWLNVAISLRFATLRLHRGAKQASEGTGGSAARSSPLSRFVAQVLAPGMSERLRVAVSSAKAKAVRHSAGPSGPMRQEPKTFGWRAPTAAPSGGSAPRVGVLVVAVDQLDELLTIIDHMALAAGDVAYELVIVDNGSVDATQLVLENRRDIRFRRLAMCTAFGAALNEAVAATDADRLVVLDPAVRLHVGAVAALSEALGAADMASPVCLDTAGVVSTSAPAALAIKRAAWDAARHHAGAWNDVMAAAAGLADIVAGEGGRAVVERRARITCLSPPDAWVDEVHTRGHG